MSWTTMMLSAAGGICLALAGVHLLVWAKARNSWANLLFGIAALMAAIGAQCELRMMHAATPEAYGYWHRMLHLPIGVLVVALALFVRLHLRAGRWWLLWTIVAMRAAVIVVNLLVQPNANFYEISGLRHVVAWGETLVIPIGTPRPWIYLIDGASLLLVAFVIDASITAWRRGQRRRAAAVGGSIIAAVVMGITFSQMHDHGVLPMPFTVSLLFLIIVTGMAYELSADLVNAAQTANDLLQTQERMNQAANSANLTIWEWAADDDEVWLSPRGRARVGASPGERLTLDRVFGSLHPDDRERMRAAMNRAATTGDEMEVECRLIVPDGSARWVSLRGKAEHNGRRGLRRLRGISLDITDRKLAEAAAAERESELEHAARVRSLGELSSTLAHELNQPLTAILSNAQAARRILASGSGNPDDLGEILDDIVGDDKRAGEIIHRMKNLIMAGEHALQRVDLGASVHAVAELLRGRLAEVGVSLSLELPADVPVVEADPVGVQQLILNLMMNAIEAMLHVPESDRRMTVAVRLEDAMAIVCVSDTGPGISPERASLVFTPFHSSKSGGLGLGLAICRRIAENHGGKLWLEESAGPGARFCFALPVREE